MDDFYRATNVVAPSLIRIEADELTYNLHIIIRYEIEKLIFNEGAKAADLPTIWNDKYKEYLGIVPTTMRRRAAGCTLVRRSFRLLPVVFARQYVCGANHRYAGARTAELLGAGRQGDLLRSSNG